MVMAQNTIKVMEYVLTNDSVVKHKNGLIMCNMLVVILKLKLGVKTIVNLEVEL